MSRKDELVLDSAPRSLPWTTKSSLLLGGWVSFTGWFLIGMMFMRLVTYWPDIHLGLDNYADGQITLVEDGEEHVYHNHFRFNYEDKVYEGVAKSIYEQYEKGDEVGIEFQYNNPVNARIEGQVLWNEMNLTPIGFGIFAISLILFRIRKGRSAITMLQNGHLAWAKLLKKEDTGKQVGPHTLYKMTFEYRDQSNHRHQIITKTHVTEELEDDPEEPVLFDPKKPENSILLDQWELYASFSNKGDLDKYVRYYGIFNACLPLIALTAFSILIWSRLHW